MSRVYMTWTVLLVCVVTRVSSEDIPEVPEWFDPSMYDLAQCRAGDYCRYLSRLDTGVASTQVWTTLLTCVQSDEETILIESSSSRFPGVVHAYKIRRRDGSIAQKLSGAPGKKPEPSRISERIYAESDSREACAACIPTAAEIELDGRSMKGEYRVGKVTLAEGRVEAYSMITSREVPFSRQIVPIGSPARKESGGFGGLIKRDILVKRVNGRDSTSYSETLQACGRDGLPQLDWNAK